MVDFSAVAEGFARDVEAGGGSISVDCPVKGIHEDDRSVALSHRWGTTKATTAIFCGGAWADRLAELGGADPDPRIVPFRGAYLELRPERASLVRGLIYPVPDPELPFLGVHLTRMIDGRVLLGPTALLKPDRRALAWPGTWRMAQRWWRRGLTEIHRALSPRSLAVEAARYVPDLRAADLRRSWSGLRAQAVGRDGALIDDFVISATARTLHLRNAPSPAATASLALADLIADRLGELKAL